MEGIGKKEIGYSCGGAAVVCGIAAIRLAGVQRDVTALAASVLTLMGLYCYKGLRPLWVEEKGIPKGKVTTSPKILAEKVTTDRITLSWPDRATDDDDVYRCVGCRVALLAGGRLQIESYWKNNGTTYVAENNVDCDPKVSFQSWKGDDGSCIIELKE